MNDFFRKYRIRIVIVGGVLGLWIVTSCVRKLSGQDQIIGKVHRGSVVEAVYGIGTVTANKIYQLKVGATSSIRTLYVREGDEVKMGAPLVFIDEMALFRAPFSGTVTALPYKTGETVFPQTPVLTVTDLKDRYLVVSLEQQAAMRVERGLDAELSFESMRDQKFTGKVRSIYSSEGQFLVNIDVPELSNKILPGMTADVAIVIRRHEKVLLAPVNGLSGEKLLIRRGYRTQEVPVKIGVVDGEVFEIASGQVEEDESVVLKGK